MSNDYPKPYPPGDFKFTDLYVNELEDNVTNLTGDYFEFTAWLEKEETKLMKEFAEHDPNSSQTTDAFIQGQLGAYRQVRRKWEEICKK